MFVFCGQGKRVSSIERIYGVSKNKNKIKKKHTV